MYGALYFPSPQVINKYLYVYLCIYILPLLVTHLADTVKDVANEELKVYHMHAIYQTNLYSYIASHGIAKHCNHMWKF